MDKQEIQKFIGSESASLSSAMQMLNQNAGGVLFLTDDNGALVCCVSDGDVRRFLLAGGKLDDPVCKAANHHPKTAKSLEEAKALYHRKNYVSIPILDEEGHIVDIYMGVGDVEKPRAKLCIPVVINAGGKGTRLEPFTKVLPKPLIPVGDLPIIELIMNEFRSYSCEAFHVIVNYKKELMKAYFAENEQKYNISWYDESKPLGTGGGLSLLKGKLDGTFFFANCDTLLTANYERMLEFHRAQHNAVTMVCVYKSISLPYGVIDMGVNGRIEGMREKPMISFLTNAGFYIVEPKVLDDLEDDMPIGFPDVVEQQRKKGRNVAAFPVGESEWMDMGQLSELEKMRERLYGK